MKSILDPSFQYTSSVSTDLRKTFARVRKEQAKHKRLLENNDKPRTVANVEPIFQPRAQGAKT
jgi:hypothetical protein